jgi:glutamyl-tRNA(Gln) amidotransferase subunit E
LSGEGTPKVLVGLEVHQQLATSTKLFCSCPPLKSEELPCSFERRLRPAQSELGKLDPAAVFEFARGRSNTYLWNPESSCLVEADEEPPHGLSQEALDAALLVALVLRSHVVDEVSVMRKIVIDGSNTGGFQRTAVVGLGGSIDVGGRSVGVQSVTVEEDAARILGGDGRSRSFALDRLGVPLVEVALDPVEGSPELVGQVALHLGRVLRSTGRVARGLGTIRQDLNVSLMGGSVVEVKGVQKLNLVPRVVEYERRRQLGLVRVAEKHRERGLGPVKCRHGDVTQRLASSSAQVLKERVAGGESVCCICATGLGGLLGWEPLPGVRLGKELAEVARANSIGGVIHSDEFAKQGVGKDDEEMLRREMACGETDALVLVAGRPEQLAVVVPQLEARLEAGGSGVPPETRAATQEGETRYMRPRPGSQRMYPETDIPIIGIDGGTLERVSRVVPEDWESTVAKLLEEYSLSEDLGLKVYDSGLVAQFRELSGRLGLEPSVVASTLVDFPARMAREGVPEEALGVESLTALLEAVASGRVSKEAMPAVAAAAAKGGTTIARAIESMGLKPADLTQVRGVVESVVAREGGLIRERGEAAFSPLMGEVMKELRGRADGAAVGRILKEKLDEVLRARDPQPQGNAS